MNISTKIIHIHLGLNYMGAGNIGDDLMIGGFLTELNRHNHKIYLTACTPFSIESQKIRFPEIKWHPYNKDTRLNLIKSADVWLGLGDTPFQSDCGMWMINHLSEELMICKQNNVPMYFLDSGLNNISVLENKTVQEIIKYTSHIWTRDNFTKKHLDKYYGNSRISSGADLAHIWLEQWKPAKLKKNSIGWVMHFENKSQFDPDIFIKVYSYFKSRSHYWLVQEIRKLHGSENDLINQIDDNIAAHLSKCIPDYLHADSLDKLIGTWVLPEILISSRYHAALIGAWAGCRVISVLRNDKLHGLVADLGCNHIPSLNSMDALVDSVNKSAVIDKNRLIDLATTAKKSVSDFINQLEKHFSELTQLNTGVPVKNNADSRNIVWIRTDSIGDNVLANSMLPHLRSHFSNSKLIVVCQDNIAELYKYCPYIDETITFNLSRMRSEAVYRENIIKKLKKLDADIVLNTVYSRNVINDLISSACGNRERIAFDGDITNITEHQLADNNKFYTQLYSNTENHREIDHHIYYLKQLGIKVDSLEPQIWTSKIDCDYADNFFTANNLKSSKVIAFFPGAQFQHKEYNQYKQVLTRFCDHVLIIFGDQKVSQMAEIICSGFNGISYNLKGKTSILEMAELMRRCHFYLGSDSAGAHIACAVGIPNIVIMGGGHFARFLPYSPLTSVVALPLNCYQCNWKCKFSITYCTKSIHPYVVVQAIKETLKKKTNKPRFFLQGKQSWKSADNIPEWECNENYIDTSLVEVITVNMDNEKGIQTDNLSSPVNRKRKDINMNATPSVKIIGKNFTNRPMIIAGMATMSTRTETFYPALRSILPQVDRLYLFFDRFDAIPEIRHAKIIMLRSQDYGDFRSSGKFLGLLMTPPGNYYLGIDDDILYPQGYVKKMVWHLNQYQNNAVSGVNGFIFKKNFKSYINDRVIANRCFELNNTYTADVLGTDTVIFNTARLTFDIRNWQYPNMVDLQFAQECISRGISGLLVPRQKFWIKELGALQPDSIYAEILSDDSRQKEYCKKIIKLQSKNKKISSGLPGVSRLPDNIK